MKDEAESAGDSVGTTSATPPGAVLPDEKDRGREKNEKQGAPHHEDVPSML